jgi:ketosteroid isomerase-like protein
VSQENAEIVRRVYGTGAFDRGEADSLMAADCEWVNPPDAIETGVLRGINEVRSASRRIADAFDWSEHRAKRVFDAGASVVAEVTFRGRGRSSGVELEHDEAHTWTFRDGKVVRFEWGRNLAEALKAVGIEE